MVSAHKFDFKGWHPKHKLAECMGDCDSNKNCESGLHCAQTNGYLKGHGCSGRSHKKYADYCVRNKHSDHYKFHGWSPKGKLGRCQGDCDSNKNCRKGLVCAQTNGIMRGFGCRGHSGKKAADYCVRAERRHPFHFKGWKPKGKLGACEGDCDKNSHCDVGLYCAQTNGYLKGHGCSGRSKKRMADYCVAPKCLRHLLWQYGAMLMKEVKRINGLKHEKARRAAINHLARLAHHASGKCSAAHRFISAHSRAMHKATTRRFRNFHFVSWNPKSRIGECEGDCDSNRNCDHGLRCAQTSGHLTKHNCGGKGKKYADYCVKDYKFNFRGWTVKGKLGICEGDCDSNKNCRAGLRCAQTNGYLKGHQCAGRGRRAADYCVSDFRPALQFLGWKPKHKLGKCQGDCDHNKDCRKGLKCGHTNGYFHHKGCLSGSRKKMADYCI